MFRVITTDNLLSPMNPSTATACRRQYGSITAESNAGTASVHQHSVFTFDQESSSHAFSLPSLPTLSENICRACCRYRRSKDSSSSYHNYYETLDEELASDSDARPNTPSINENSSLLHSSMAAKVADAADMEDGPDNYSFLSNIFLSWCVDWAWARASERKRRNWRGAEGRERERENCVGRTLNIMTGGCDLFYVYAAVRSIS